MIRYSFVNFVVAFLRENIVDDKDYEVVSRKSS